MNLITATAVGSKLIWDGKLKVKLPEGTYRYSVIVTPISGEEGLSYQEIFYWKTPPKRPILLLPTEDMRQLQSPMELVAVK